MSIEQQRMSGSTRQRFPQAVWVLAAILCVIAALQGSSNPLRLLNLATWITAAGIAVGVIALARHPLRARWWGAAASWAAGHGIDLPLLLLAIGLGTLTAVRHALRLGIDSPHTGHTVLLWVVSWSALLAAVWPREATGLRAWLRTHQLELAGVAGLTLVAAAVRLYQLGAIPNVINGDEGLIGMWALGVSDRGNQPALYRHFGAVDGVGVLYLRLMNGVFELFGTTPFTLRLLPAIAGILAIPANYLLARHLLGRRAAVIAAGLLVVSHTHIHFSRTVAVSYIYTTLFLPLALYFLITGMERRSGLRLVLSALTIGIHINFYLDGWAWLVLLFLVLAAWAVVDRSIFRGNGVNLALFLIAIAIIMAPMVIWARMYAGDFVSRVAADGTFASGWLEREVQLTGKSQATILWELFGYAMGTFTEKPFLYFYWVDAPMLDTMTGYLWMGGLALVMLGIWNRKMIVLSGWFWGGIVALALMTIPKETYSYRLLVVLPAVLMMAALCADQLLRYIERVSAPGQPPNRLWGAAMVGLLLIAGASLNHRIYYQDFAPSCRYGSSYSTREASLLGSHLATLPRNTQVFILPNDLDASFYAGPYKSLDFLSGRLPMTNLVSPLGESAPPELALNGGNSIAFVAPPERMHEFARLQSWLPGGQESRIVDCGAEKLGVYYWSGN